MLTNAHSWPKATIADDAQTRKLATIVALDVAGYSARTEADEARTTAEVAALRKIIEGIAVKYGGRVSTPLATCSSNETPTWPR